VPTLNSAIKITAPTIQGAMYAGYICAKGLNYRDIEGKAKPNYSNIIASREQFSLVVENGNFNCKVKFLSSV